MKVRWPWQRSPVGAPRMTVSAHVPLGTKIAVGVVATIVAIAAGVAFSRSDFAHANFGDANPAVQRLADENVKLREERDQAREIGNTADSSRAMERATIKELGDQIARLEADNTRLKEDVAFFEAATADRTSSSARGADGGIAIRRFQVTQDRTAHTARYRILLTQDSKAKRDFVGGLQLAITFVQGGKAVSIVLPDEAGRRPVAPSDSAALPYAVVFRTYKRVDGSFEVPPDAVLRSVQARILESGAVRVQQTFTVNDR